MRQPAPGQSQSGLGDSLVYVFHCCVRVIVITPLACQRDVERGLGRSCPPWVELGAASGSRAEFLRLRAALDIPPARPFFFHCWFSFEPMSALCAKADISRQNPNVR